MKEFVFRRGGEGSSAQKCAECSYWDCAGIRAVKPAFFTVYNAPVLPRIQPMRLARVAKPFDDPNYIFELKHDGFRVLT